MGKRGESSRDAARNAILLFASDQKGHTRSEFIRELVGRKQKFAKNTVYKYLDELVDYKLLKMQPGSREDSFRPEYSITELGQETVKRIELNNVVGSLKAKYLSVVMQLATIFISKLEKAGWSARQTIETQIFMFVPEKRGKDIIQHLYLSPLEEEAMNTVTEYLKEKRLIR